MYIKVKVTAGAKKETFLPVSKEEFKVSVKEPAERNLANNRIRELIAIHYKLPIGKTRIISGHHSPSKILSVNIED